MYEKWKSNVWSISKTDRRIWKQKFRFSERIKNRKNKECDDVRFQETEPMNADQKVSIGIDLQQVAVFRIKPETPKAQEIKCLNSQTSKVTHLHKTTFKSYLWLLALIEYVKEKQTLLIMTSKLSFSLNCNWIYGEKLLACMELVCNKYASSRPMIFRIIMCMKSSHCTLQGFIHSNFVLCMKYTHYNYFPWKCNNWEKCSSSSLRSFSWNLIFRLIKSAIVQLGHKYWFNANSYNMV